MKIFITGANGYIGSHLVRFLADAGHSVKAVARKPLIHNGPAIETLVVSGLEALAEPDFKGIDIVIHAAGRAHRASAVAASSFYRDNVQLALTLAQKAHRAGVKRFIFISSIGADLLEKELAWTQKPFDQAWLDAPYRASKLVAERELQSYAKESGLELVILRLPMVFGAEAPGNFALLVRAVRGKIPLPFGAIHNRRAFVGIHTVCDFVSTCLEHPKAPGTWAIRNGDQISTPDFVQFLAVALGLRARLFLFPPMLIRWAGIALGRRLTVESLLDSLEIDLKPVQEILGWTPKETIGAELRHTMRT